MFSPYDVVHVALIGFGATALMDLWLLLLKHLGVQTTDFALIGRWVGHLAHGHFAHASIVKARPISSELGLGWLTHYAVGIAFAGLLVVVQGIEWLHQPTFLPALTIGLGTVIVPLFVIQPALGSGFGAAKTPAPLMTCLRTLINHAVFGCGLYAAAALFQWVVR
jgi:hypothetical protein